MKGIGLGVPIPSAEHHEGWEHVGNQPSGEGLTAAVDTLQARYGIANVATGGSVPPGIGMVGLWVRKGDWERVLASSYYDTYGHAEGLDVLRATG
jgi:hypothetical protein